MDTPCTCTALRAATRKLTALYDEAMAEAGINIAQFSLLRRIGQGQPLSLTGLAERAELDRSTVGRNVKILQRMGLVENTPCADRREATVSLSGEGRARLQAGAPLWEQVQRRVRRTLGDDGLAQLQSLLQSL